MALNGSLGPLRYLRGTFLAIWLYARLEDRCPCWRCAEQAVSTKPIAALKGCSGSLVGLLLHQEIFSEMQVHLCSEARTPLYPEQAIRTTTSAPQAPYWSLLSLGTQSRTCHSPRLFSVVTVQVSCSQR